MKIQEDKGYILITCLLLLLVLTVIGLSAIGTSTLENILSGNVRLRETNLLQADAGTTLSPSIIERAIRKHDVRGFSSIMVDSDNFPLNIRVNDFDDDTYDAFLAIDEECAADPSADPTVIIDIDKMYVKYIGGSAIEFASGYEGIGKSGSNDYYAFYRINSKSRGPANSEGCAGCIYRYVPK